MSNNKILYKQRPYIYALLGIIAFSYAKNSILAFICGVVLLICSFLVFEMRKKPPTQTKNSVRQTTSSNVNKIDSKNK